MCILSLSCLRIGLEFGLISWCGSVQQPPAPEMLSYGVPHLIDNALDMVYGALPLQILGRHYCQILGQDRVRFPVSD